jgi:glycosyltransferase involved in cell wall biosynthesis
MLENASCTMAIFHESPTAPLGGKVGGAAGVVAEQSTRLHDMGKEVKVVAPKPNGAGTAIEHPHFPTHLFDPLSVHDNDEMLAGEPHDKLTDILKKEKNGGTVYAHYFVAGGIAAEIAQAANNGDRNPFIYMGHSWDRVNLHMDPHRKITPVRAKAEALILEQTDRIIVATQAEARLLAKSYNDILPEEDIMDKTRVVPLGVDHQIFNPYNKAQKRETARKHYLPEDLQNSLAFYMLGRISQQKNHANAISAFAEVIHADPKLDLSLLIAGGPLKGEYYDRIQEQMRQYPEEVTRRIKWLDRQEAIHVVSAGDVFLGPSEWETWFLALSESQAVGNPTIVSDQSILREVGGAGTIYTDPYDIDSIARSIYNMATDPQMREEAGRMNYCRAQHYTWENSANTLHGIIKELT